MSNNRSCLTDTTKVSEGMLEKMNAENSWGWCRCDVVVYFGGRQQGLKSLDACC